MRSLTLLLLVVLVVVFCVSHQGFVSAADEPKADEFLPSILLDSVVNHDLDGVHKAIENGENIDLVNPNGWSAARFAVSQNDLDMLRELIDAKIDLNNADNSGVTPLMAAAQAVSKFCSSYHYPLFTHLPSHYFRLIRKWLKSYSLVMLLLFKSLLKVVPLTTMRSGLAANSLL